MMEDKDIYIVYAEKNGRGSIVPFESSKRAVDFFKKHGGVIIQRVNVSDMNDIKSEMEALEELEICDVPSQS